MKVSKNVTFEMENIGIVARFMEDEHIKNFSRAINEIITLWIRKEKLVKTLENIAQERAIQIEDMKRKTKLNQKYGEKDGS